MIQTQTKNCSESTIFEFFFILVFGFPNTWTPVSEIFMALYNDIIIGNLHPNYVHLHLEWIYTL